MTEFGERYDRNIRLFGAEGQRKLRATTIALVGAGGLGSPSAQHFALLGVKRIVPIDDEQLDESNRNRFVGARHDDPVPGSYKVDLIERLVREINPDVDVTPIAKSLISEEGFGAVQGADVVVGCLDHDGPRAVLNELCAAYDRPYFDLASDVPDASAYGGRVCSAVGAGRCLACSGLLDSAVVEAYAQPTAQREVRDKIYGVDRSVLEEKGPSVSPLNGVVASLAAMEVMAFITGMRAPHGLLNYHGHLGKVTVGTDPALPSCYVCNVVRRTSRQANVERFLSLPHLRGPRS